MTSNEKPSIPELSPALIEVLEELGDNPNSVITESLRKAIKERKYFPPTAEERDSPDTNVDG